MHENEIGMLIADSVVDLHQDHGAGSWVNVDEATLAANVHRRGLLG